MTNDINGNAISRDEIVNYSKMAETGDYGADCATGRLLADALIKRMADTDYTPALGEVVSEIVKAGRWGAVHIGFFQRLADRSVKELA